MLFVLACTLPALRLVPLKLLPYDNKDEFQLVVDMPEGTTLERTEAVAAALADYLVRVPEVDTVAAFTGLASPIDFIEVVSVSAASGNFSNVKRGTLVTT